MGIELSELEFGEETYEGRLNRPEGDAESDVGVVMIPGAGHGPFGNIFDIVAYELAGTGRHVFRYESWEDTDELEAKAFGDLRAEVNAAVARLRDEGCSEIHLIAKSFGGGIALTHVPDAVDRLVLWAPAVELVEGSVDHADDERIGDTEDLPIAVGTADLEAIDVPVRLLVGDEDRGVSPEECERIAGAVGDGNVTVLPGENHSFNENRRAIVAETFDALAVDR
ncbi:alpha/beta hydrolase [Halostella litorea]|uniref:alpha/beta hydrolase n=1 Tax=Halostella litorea TaxID=2528831 RepID=UPI001091F8DE|nr:alpha/beta hydrolase [Halostella litorea]